MSKHERIFAGYEAKKSMPPKLKDLPSDLQDIAATGQAYVDENGMRPIAGSCRPFIYGPLADKMSPMTANARINKYAAANPDCGFYTYKEFFDFYKIGTASKDGRPKITARNIFNRVAAYLKESHAPDTLNNPDQILAGYKISVLDKAFCKANIPDLTEFLSPDVAQPKSVYEFALMVGLITSANTTRQPG